MSIRVNKYNHEQNEDHRKNKNVPQYFLEYFYYLRLKQPLQLNK